MRRLVVCSSFCLGFSGLPTGLLADPTSGRAREATPAAVRSQIVFCGASDSPPYEYVDAHGQPKGFNVELVRALAREAGREVEFRLGPWNEVLNHLEAGEADIVAIAYSEDRAKRYDLIADTWMLQGVAAFLPGSPILSSRCVRSRRRGGGDGGAVADARFPRRAPRESAPPDADGRIADR